MFAETSLGKALELENTKPFIALSKSEPNIIPQEVIEARSCFLDDISHAIEKAKENIPPPLELKAPEYAHIHIKDFVNIIQDQKLIKELAKKKEVFLIGNLSDKKDLQEKQINYCSKALHALVNAGIKIQNKIYATKQDLPVASERIIPNKTTAIAACEAIYEDLPGWQESTPGIKRFAELPKNAQQYLLRIEQLAGVPIHLISTGPDRHETIILHHPFEDEMRESMS